MGVSVIPNALSALVLTISSCVITSITVGVIPPPFKMLVIAAPNFASSIGTFPNAIVFPITCAVISIMSLYGALSGPTSS